MRKSFILKQEKEARVLSSETKKRLGFFSLNYNDTILHFFKFEEPEEQTSDFS